MKKIMFYWALFYIGGTEAAILNLIKKLKGYDIYIGYRDETSDKEMLKNISKYAKVVNINNPVEEEFDYLVTCSTHYHQVEQVSKIKRKKTILWVHNLVKLETSVLADENLAKNLDHVVTVSKTVMNTLISRYPHLEKITSTINNPLDVEEIKNNSLSDYQLELSETLNLVTVSRLAESKGFSRMKHLARCFKEKNISFKWFVVGHSYYEDEARKIIESFDEFKDNFCWLGFMSNPHQIVRKCDYSVLLSDEETWGLVLTEAMILGVPCIATDFDVVYEQITDGENGIILSRDDLSTYENRIMDILSNKEKYRKKVENYRFDNDLIIKSWDNLFSDK